LTLLDAYPLVALLADEPAADEVEQLLREGEASIAVINLCEAIDVCRRVRALPAADVRAVLEPLLLVGALTAVASGEREAWLAADIRTRYYDRRARALSIADCLLLAHAAASGKRIATADPAVAEVARAEGLELVPLPSSRGERP